MSEDKTLKREIHLARKIQTQLLSGEKPILPNGEISGISIPARMIGGDYYDFYPLSDGKIRIIIGDVMGKGIPAAMLMILTRGAFRSASETTKGPGETLTAMNNAMYKDMRKLGSFVTIFCADWNPYTKLFTYANAGHNLPVRVGAKAEVSSLPQIKGVMVGGLPNQNYQEEHIRLEDNELIFFYTDGIVEAQDHKGRMFKLQPLTDLLIQNVHEKAEEIEKKVVEEINKFTKGLPQKDDITMVVLKVGKGDSEISSYHTSALSP